MSYCDPIYTYYRNKEGHCIPSGLNCEAMHERRSNAGLRCWGCGKVIGPGIHTEPLQDTDPKNTYTTGQLSER